MKLTAVQAHAAFFGFSNALFLGLYLFKIALGKVLKVLGFAIYQTVSIILLPAPLVFIQ